MVERATMIPGMRTPASSSDGGARATSRFGRLLVVFVVSALMAVGLPVGALRVAVAQAVLPKALLVTAESTVSPQEQPLVGRLVAGGFSVVTVKDDDLRAQHTLGMQLVVVASTVNSVLLLDDGQQPKLTKVSASVISLKAYGNTMMSMAGPVEATDYDAVSTAQVRRLSPRPHAKQCSPTTIMLERVSQSMVVRAQQPPRHYWWTRWHGQPRRWRRINAPVRIGS